MKNLPQSPFTQSGRSWNFHWPWRPWLQLWFGLSLHLSKPHHTGMESTMGLGQKIEQFHIGWFQHGLLGSTGIHRVEDHCWAPLSNPGIFSFTESLVMSLLGFPKMEYNIPEDKSIIFRISQMSPVVLVALHKDQTQDNYRMMILGTPSSLLSLGSWVRPDLLTRA